jgi:hypothetical protein
MVYLTRYISYFFVRVCGDNSLACSISICEAVCPGKPYHYHLNSKAVFLNKSSKLLGMVHGEANLASSISQTACTWSPKSPSPSISVAQRLTELTQNFPHYIPYFFLRLLLPLPLSPFPAEIAFTPAVASMTFMPCSKYPPCGVPFISGCVRPGKTWY